MTDASNKAIFNRVNLNANQFKCVTQPTLKMRYSKFSSNKPGIGSIKVRVEEVTLFEYMRV